MNTKIKAVRSSGTYTTLVGTDTNHVLHVGTGTTLSWYQYHFGSGEWYRYHFALVPVPFGLCKVVPIPPLLGYQYHFTELPRNGRFCHFEPNFSFLNIFNSSYIKTHHEYNSSNTYNGGLEFLKPNPSHRIQGFIPKFTNLYKTLEIGRIPYQFDTNYGCSTQLPTNLRL